MTKLLFTVGQSPDGYAAVEVGQKAYMSQLMEYHLNPDLPAGQVVDDDTEGVVRRIAEKSGEVSGTLALGRQEELAAGGKEADEAYKDSMDLVKRGISGGLGTAVGVGTSFVATPWIGAVAGGATTTITGTVLESMFQDFKSTELEDSEDARGELWQDGLESDGNRSGQAARLAAEEHGMVDPADAETWARESGAQASATPRRSSTAVPRVAGQRPDEVAKSPRFRAALERYHHGPPPTDLRSTFRSCLRRHRSRRSDRHGHRVWRR
ncbi:hypothetical protein [Streptomyces sp. NPDC088719]|uniref:hypothetical protein n=1 Tax=Streptomyces sp. NPDC088719 TaxID=3365872 RepID=UPI003828CF5F